MSEDLLSKYEKIAEQQGTVDVVRTWTARRTEKGWRLFAAVQQTQWTRGVETAICTKHPEHKYPTPGCLCGFQGVWPERRDVIEYHEPKERDAAVVIGTIRVWGKMFLGDKGVRAQYAQVLAVDSVRHPRVADAPTRRYGSARCQIDHVTRGMPKRDHWCMNEQTHDLAISHPKTGKAIQIKVCKKHGTVADPPASRRECDVTDCHARPFKGIDGVAWRCKKHQPSAVRVKKESETAEARNAERKADLVEVLRDLAWYYEMDVTGEAARLLEVAEQDAAAAGSDAPGGGAS